MTIPSLSGVGVGVGELLGACQVGMWSDNPGADDVAIVLGALPPAPAKAIAIVPYPLQDDPLLSDSVIAVQLRIRGDGDLRTGLDLSAAAFNALNGLQSVQMGGIYMAMLWRQSSAVMGLDENQQWNLSDNYYGRVNWPTQYRDR